jgi:diaminopropionate ammonia-lyase
MPSRYWPNPGASPSLLASLAVSPGDGPRELHRRLPGYAPTPVVDLPDLATAAGVGRVVAKAEVERFGLPSFKVLGASWATYRLLCERLGEEPQWTTVDDLATVVAASLGRLRLAAATDGNHGRAVAHMARLLGLDATILVPEGTAQARIDGIAGEGAEVVVVDGSYDEAVAASAELASDRTLVVSDTSWPGYEQAPRWVIEGYSTIFAELAAQLPAAPDVVLVPLGVGALGAATATALGADAVLVGVEPDSAACVLAAVEAGGVVEVPGPHRSIMAGLNCGLASPLALPVVAAGFTGFVAVDDDRCRAAVRLLADADLDVGETGAAALAGLTALADEHPTAGLLTPDTTVLLLATEGVTDPANFERIVGRPPRPRPVL